MMQYEITDLINIESKKAFDKYGVFNSTHEIYGVLMEEVEEFWELVKQKDHTRSREEMINELIQIAAIAQRAIYEIEKGKVKWV